MLAYFQWRLLRHVGLMGDLIACVSCGRALRAQTTGRPANAVYFSSRQGGLLCTDCEPSHTEKRPLRPATLAGLALLHAAAGGAKVQLPEDQAAGINRMLGYHAQEQLGKALRMARYVLG